MIDGVGNVESILVLGGTSEIGLAIVDRMVSRRLSRVVLAGPECEGLGAAAARVRGFGVGQVETPRFAATETWSHARLVDQIFDAGDVDLVVLAADVGDGLRDSQTNPAVAIEIASANYTGSVSIGLQVARRMQEQGHGFFVILSSVAGERPRQSDFIFGSSMAGLDAFAVGLGESLRKSGVRVIVCRIAQVSNRDSTVPTGPRKSGTVADPPAIGDSVAAAIRSRRSDIIYVPASLRTVMSGLRHLPRPVFRRLPL